MSASVKDEKKAWLISVVLSLGNAMNGHLELKGGELYVADANVATDGAYSLPTDVAKSLQKEVSAGSAQAWGNVRENPKELVRKELPALLGAPTLASPQSVTTPYDDSASDMVSMLLRNMSR